METIMKTFLMMGVGLALAGTCAMAQPVVGLGRVEAGEGAGAAVIGRNAPTPVDTPLKAGPNGAILLFPDGSRVRIAPESLFVLSGGVRANPPLESPVEAPPDATSAVKSILTQRNTQRARNQAELAVARDMLTLNSGALIADQRATTMDVQVLQQTLRAADARFAVTIVSPGNARLTVAQGEVTVSAGSTAAFPVAAGEFTLLKTDAAGGAIASAPSKITGNDLALADETALRLGQAGRLAPVGERIDPSKDPEAVGERLGDQGVGSVPATAAGPGVGTGPSVPFDLPRVLSTPNPSNTHGAVQSPEQP